MDQVEFVTDISKLTETMCEGYKVVKTVTHECPWDSEIV